MNLNSEKRIDLFKYMTNKDKKNGWCAGDQIEALRFYLNKDVKILSTAMVGSYQGDCFAILRIKDVYIVWRDSFGSCSGCDALENQNGYKYIKSTLSEGNTIQFNNLFNMKHYIMKEQIKNKYGGWDNMPITMIENLIYNR
jgi:hypothetical protein